MHRGGFDGRDELSGLVMMTVPEERRRELRVTMAAGLEFRLSKRVSVRVVDISGSGALLAADERLAVGTRAWLQVPLGHRAFEAQVEVKRVDEQPDRPVLHGTVIVAIDRRNQQTLDDFLRPATS